MFGRLILQGGLKYPSLFLFIATLAFFLLQNTPTFGLILLFSGRITTLGTLISLFLISLFFESLIGRIYRVFVLVPVIAFSGYYYLVFQQNKAIGKMEAQLAHSNPTLLIKYSSDKHSLVSDLAEVIVTRYKVPVAYRQTKARKELETRSYRLVAKADCDKIKEDSLGNTQKKSTGYYDANNKYHRYKHLCIITQKEALPKNSLIVRKSKSRYEKYGAKFEDSITTIVADGKKIGEYRTSKVRRYSTWPTLISLCLPRKTTSWSNCHYEFMTKWQSLKSNPSKLGTQKIYRPSVLMLGLERRSHVEAMQFTGYASNQSALQHIAGSKERSIKHMFKQLDAVLDDKQSKFSWMMRRTLVLDPPSLNKRAVRLIGFLESTKNNQYYRSKIRDWYKKEKLIFHLLTWLPDDTLKKFESRIENLINTKGRKTSVGLIYSRMADIRPHSETSYVDDLIDSKNQNPNRTLIMTGLCRLPKISHQTITLVKSHFKKEIGKKHPDEQLIEVAFLALVKHGQTTFLSSVFANYRPHYYGWYKSVLNGDGKTTIGPNNCNYRDAYAPEYPHTMRPTLPNHWKDE